jgi:BMFP domain-containing protein YqiC
MSDPTVDASKMLYARIAELEATLQSVQNYGAARIAELEAALKPFAELDPVHDDDTTTRTVRVTSGDIRRAKASRGQYIDHLHDTHAKAAARIAELEAEIARLTRPDYMASGQAGEAD